ncbi:MAG: DNA gyrase inhibitor YacG [Thermoguttaceae bacterium]|nr:DNA gyrase inhibitor YacG [Thermoguttaceae bacterium]
MKCPICGATFSADKPDAALPFCSKRCKIIDAKRWLCEEYGVPVTKSEEELEKELASLDGVPVSDPERN